MSDLKDMIFQRQNTVYPQITQDVSTDTQCTTKAILRKQLIITHYQGQQNILTITSDLIEHLPC